MPYPVSGFMPVASPPVRGTVSIPRFQSASPADDQPSLRADLLDFSPDARALGSLLRTWDTLSRLLGRKGSKRPGGLASPPDLAALRQTLMEVREKAERAQTRVSVINTLKTSVLRQAEGLVERVYGLRGDGANLTVVLEEDMGGALAAVSYQHDRDGRMTNQHLHVSLRQFTPDTGPNGTNGHVIENDRIIAHEMTHAVMGRSMDISQLPDWFMEGTAEYVAGGAERVSIVLKRFSPQQLMDRLSQPWEGDSTQYAASYVAVRYFDEATREHGGLRALMGRLQQGQPLDAAMREVSQGVFADAVDFLDKVSRRGLGADYLRTIDVSGKDPGAIGGGKGPDIVPDVRSGSAQPLKGFRVQWPSPVQGIFFTSPAFGPGGTGGLFPAGFAAAAYRTHAR